MSRSKTALVHLNIPFLETLSILILRINHHACVGICSCIPAESALVSCSNASLRQWNGYYLQTDTDVRYEKVLHLQAPKELHEWNGRWSQTTVQVRPIYCDAHRSLWKQHANLDFPSSYERGLLSTFWELWSGQRCVDGFSGCCVRIFPNLIKQMSLNVVYLLSLGCAAHLYSWGLSCRSKCD